MKIRKDFVTNSSSSSYVCEICGRADTTWDGLAEIEMIECENGHTFCESEMLYEPTRADLIKAALEYKYHEFTEEELVNMDDDQIFREVEMRYELPERFCPICQFIEYSTSDLSEYLEKKYSVSRDEVFAEIKKLNKRRKKLYDTEYIAHVCSRFGVTPAAVVAGWKEEFGTYGKFKKWLRSK